MSKTFKITNGIKLNVGKKSFSTTIGKRGLSINTGTKGTFINIGIPGTGIKCRQKLFKKNNSPTIKTKIFKYCNTHDYNTHRDNVIKGATILGLIIGGAIFLIWKSFLWSFVPVFLIPILYSFTENDKH